MPYVQHFEGPPNPQEIGRYVAYYFGLNLPPSQNLHIAVLASRDSERDYI